MDVGEVGEIVVTTLDADYPLIRLALGDLTATIPVQGCGRTNQRIAGWMGRADQTTKVKGMFVRPEQIDSIRKTSPGTPQTPTRGHAKPRHRTP